MDIIIFYSILIYIIYAGFITNEYDKYSYIPFGVKISFFFAPLIVSFLIGAALSNILNKSNK